ncbi:hypothetical protein ACJX0J_020802, partial [Zea mays]
LAAGDEGTYFTLEKDGIYSLLIPLHRANTIKHKTIQHAAVWLWGLTKCTIRIEFLSLQGKPKHTTCCNLSNAMNKNMHAMIMQDVFGVFGLTFSKNSVKIT